MNIRALLIALVIVIPISSHAGGSGKPQRVSGVYSSLYFNEEGGDLLGIEVMLVPQAMEKYSAFVQISEGGEPYMAVVPVTVQGAHVEFVMPAGGEYAGVHFTGTVSASELVLSWPDGTTERLKHGKSYWE